LKHSIDWLDGVPNAVPEEQATVADLRLWLNGHNVTKYISGDQLEDHVTVALFGLVNGLVHDWWTIFGARDKEFSLRRYRSGYLIPDVRLFFDGSAFEVSAHESAFVDPDLQFLGGTQEVLSREDGEAWLSSLINETLTRLKQADLNTSSAALRWERVQSSRRSDERHFCEAAGSLGLDPYNISDTLANFIENAEKVFDNEALIEFVSDAGNVDQIRLIGWVERMMGIKGHQYRLADLRPLVDQISSVDEQGKGEQAWAIGYRRARSMRRALNLKQTDKFEGFADLAQRLGSKNFQLAPKVNGINALRREGIHGVNIHVRNHGEGDYAPTMHLFALARAIGDVACFPLKEAAPINRLQKAYRQAAGRAFAAEFLSPIDEIKSMRADDKDEYTIASAFRVAPQVVYHQIENEKRIAQVCCCD
jgi:hypothetical protein